MGYSQNNPRSSLKKKSLPRCHWNAKTKNKHHRKTKTSYNSYEEAMKFLIKHKLENEFTVYKCPICNKYHVGHKEKEI